MEENLEKFERFLKNKEQFLKDMLSIVHDELIAEKLETQLALLRDIIHHYKVIVKDEITNNSINTSNNSSNTN